MAGNGTVLLQVPEFALAGIDRTQRKIILEGSTIILEGAIATLAVVAGGTGWAVGDLFLLPGGQNGIGKVATVTSGAIATVTLSNPGVNYSAQTAAPVTALYPSNGTGATITTTVNTNGGQIINITGWSITSNACTFTAVNTLTGGGGQVITTQGFPSAFSFLNATFTVTSATSTTIVVPLTHANGSGSQSGIAFLQGTYQNTGGLSGLPISYNFVDQYGRPNPIAPLGPLAVPDWFEAITIAGSTYNYKINSTVTPNLLLIFNGVTQVTDTTVITADTMRYRAEFVNGAF